MDKKKDFLHCADVLVFNADNRLVLARIANTPGTLYAGALGSTVAMIVRVDESAADAAKRALEREIGVMSAELVELREKFFAYDEGVKRLKTTF